jgi:hypothetical protein
MKMKKTILNEFINKYSLGGEIKSVKWNTTNGVLETRSITGDKSVVLEISSKKPLLKKGLMLGIYDTPTFSKIISPLEEDIKIGYKKENLIIKDNEISSTFCLSDITTIPSPPNLKNLPDNFELNFNLDMDWIEKFITTRGALTEVETFTIFPEINGNGKLVVGWASINSNRIELKFPHNKLKSNFDFNGEDKISFCLKHFYEFLKAHRTNKEINIQISSQGLMRVETENENFKSLFYFVSTTSVN